MAHYIFIEGKDVTADITDFSKFTLEVGYNSNKAIVNKLSETFSFENDTDTYKLLKSTFFNGCNGLDKELKGFFKSDSCGSILVPLTITVNEASYSTESIEVLMESDDIDDTAYNYFDSTYWFNNDFPTAYPIPLMYFAVQPSFLAWVIIILTMPIRFALNVIERILKDLCEIASITDEGVGGFKCSQINLTRNVFEDLDNWLTGLGRWSTAPLVREILTHHCHQTGLKFQSSIINDPLSDHYNMAMFDLSRGQKGTFKDTSKEKRIEVLLGNSYLMTVLELIKRIADLFEAEYRIINGTLYLEEPAFFEKLRTKRLFAADDCTKYEYNLQDMYAYGEFAFSQDGLDKEGNKVSELYQQKLEWNKPYRKSQKGKLSRNHFFGPCRFMFDHLSFRKDGFFDWERLIDEFRDGPETFIQGFVATEGVQRKNDLIVSDDYLSFPKLVILEDNFDRNDVSVVKKQIGTIKSKPFYLFNFPLLYKETSDSIVNEQLVPGEEGVLTGYAKTANPRLRKDLMKINEITQSCDCEVIRNVVNSFHEVYIDTEFGKGIPENATINFDNGKIDVVFNDIKVVCVS